MTVKLAVVGLAAIGFASVAHAQDVIIEGDAPVVEQAPADDAVILQERAPAPRVYGWAMRPADCGHSVTGTANVAPMRAMSRR